MHGVEPSDVTMAVTASGGTAVALAGLHESERDSLAAFLAWGARRTSSDWGDGGGGQLCVCVCVCVRGEIILCITEIVMELVLLGMVMVMVLW